MGEYIDAVIIGRLESGFASNGRSHDRYATGIDHERSVPRRNDIADVIVGACCHENLSGLSQAVRIGEQSH